MTTETKAVTVLEEIRSRLGAADIGADCDVEDDVGENEHAVGLATPEVKRLQIVRHLIDEEHNLLVERAKEIQAKLQSRTKGGGLAGIRAIWSGAFAADKAEIDELERLEENMRGMQKLHEIVSGMFWLEVRRTYPELRGKDAIGIRKGWQICWFEPTPDEMIKQILGDALSEHLLNAKRHR